MMATLVTMRKIAVVAGVVLGLGVGGWFGMSSALGADKELWFNAAGKFKIVQFTDTHFTGQNEDLTPEQAKAVGAQVLKDMATILDQEKPDLVVFTGDNVLTPDLEYWSKLVDPVEKRGILWAAVMGNHDAEKTGKTRKELMQLVSTFPHSLGICGPEALGGGGNYVLPIQGPAGPAPKAVLYFLDSGDYAPHKQLGDYAWITFDQIAWFRQQCAAFTKANHNQPLPSLAFYHIPVPEYNDIGSQGPKLGDKFENICAPQLNSGFLTALVETQSVMGCFVGHDHVNDEIGNVRGVCLAYGRKTGEFSYHKLTSGARVIELNQDQFTFTTWICTGTGQREAVGHWPEHFLPKPEKK